MDSRPRILLVGDDVLARSGLATSLAMDSAIAVVGQVAPGDDVSREITRLEADTVLWDAGLDFSTALDRLREQVPFLADVCLIAGAERGAREALGLGVRGLLLRGAAVARISATLSAIEQGVVVLDPMISEALFSPPRAPPSPSLFTARELEVLGLMSEGLSNKLIGARLGISENTAKFHVNGILSKLGAETRTEAVVLAARLGVLVL